MRLSEAHIAIKIALTAGLTLAAAAFAASALLARETAGSPSSTSPLVTIEDYRIKYGASPLERSLHGPMRRYLPAGSQRESVLGWLRKGGDRTGYYEEVEPILAAHCTSCHGASGTAAGGIELTHYLYVEPLAAHRGATRRELLRFTHIHLFGIGLVLAALGLLAAWTRHPPWTRIVMVLLPPIALTAEVLSWWLTPLWTAAARIGWIGAHALLVSMLGAMLFILLDLWSSPRQRGDL